MKINLLIVVLNIHLLTACVSETSKIKTSKIVYKDSTEGINSTHKVIDTLSRDTAIDYNLKISDSLVFLYLTFDDGPNNGTPKLLQILEEYQIQASLFIVGKHVYCSKFQQQLFKSYSNYKTLELCNHSYSHANNKYKEYYSKPMGVLKDFIRCQDSLKFQNRIGRAPGKNMWRIKGDDSRFRSSSKAAELLVESDFKMVGWDIDWDFKQVTDHKHLLKRLIEIENTKWPMGLPSFYPGHLVVLMHDQSFTKEEHCTEFRKFLDIIKSMPQKYRFKKISEYPLLKNKQVIDVQ